MNTRLSNPGGRRAEKGKWTSLVTADVICVFSLQSPPKFKGSSNSFLVLPPAAEGDVQGKNPQLQEPTVRNTN